MLRDYAFNSKHVYVYMVKNKVFNYNSKFNNSCINELLLYINSRNVEDIEDLRSSNYFYLLNSFLVNVRIYLILSKNFI